MEVAISKGLLNYLDPSHSGIKGFEPSQLHALIKKAIVQANFSVCFTVLGYCKVCRDPKYESRILGSWGNSL